VTVNCFRKVRKSPDVVVIITSVYNILSHGTEVVFDTDSRLVILMDVFLEANSPLLLLTLIIKLTLFELSMDLCNVSPLGFINTLFFDYIIITSSQILL